MKGVLKVPADKKLSVIYRVEPGCLGPEGKTKVTGFCEFVQQEVLTLDAGYVNWLIEPRFDKSLPEMQFNIAGKKMTSVQADKYLSLFDKNLDEFETRFIEKLASLIDDYMGQ